MRAHPLAAKSGIITVTGKSWFSHSRVTPKNVCDYRYKPSLFMLLCSLAACLGGPDPRTHSLEGTKGRRRQQRCRKVKCSQSHRNGLHISAIHATRLLKSRERAHQVLSKFQHLSSSTYLDVRSLFDLPYILYTQSHGAWDALQSWLRMYEVQSVSVPRYAYRTLCICMHLFRRGITMSSCSNLVAKVCVHDRRSLSLSLSLQG